MNKGLNKRAVAVDSNFNLIPRDVEQIKRDVARGYEIARAKRPELPPSITMREFVALQAKARLGAKKHSK